MYSHHISNIPQINTMMFSLTALTHRNFLSFNSFERMFKVTLKQALEVIKHTCIRYTYKLRVWLEAKTLRILIPYHLNILLRRISIEYCMIPPHSFTTKASRSH
jgi:hypothetical protein